jgi:membrane-bound ClpP family serine protease
MSWTVIAALIVIGLIFLILEILVVPGTTVIGVVGFILMGIGIWQTYIVYGTPMGHYVLGGSMVLTIGALVLSLRSKTWNRAMLHTEINSKANVYDGSKIKAGDTGKTVSRLVPMGKALINNDYYEVRSTGEFIDQETEIIVTKIEFNKIYVKPKLST